MCVCVCACACARVGLKVNRNPRLDARMQTQLTGPKTSWVIINTINNLFFSHRRHCQLLANFISTANNPLLLLRTAWSNFFKAYTYYLNKLMSLPIAISFLCATYLPGSLSGCSNLTQ
jgi:hypothetical protein